MTALAPQDRLALRSVYAPPALAPASDSWRLEELIGDAVLRYFAYGRHALAEALRVAGVQAGDTVLLPGFICREVLSAVHAAGARVDYYPVNSKLAPDCDVAALPAAKAIIAVDYFGFAQDLAPFRQYCAARGAALIEDNAHGLFSRDATGAPLGTRGDLGVFSLRKTLATPDGAALVVNAARLAPALAPQLPFDTARPSTVFRVKQQLRAVSSAIGSGPARAMTALTRAARQLTSGSAILPSVPEAETVMPPNPAPSSVLRDVMAHTDVAAECARRRRLYEVVSMLLDPPHFPPVFTTLPPDTVPYGYPFVADAAAGAAASRLLARHGLECFQWPALPDAIAPAAPAHYRSVWMASFLW